MVAPSLLPEGLPTVLAEAMWAGIPVVATRVGGIQHLFGDQRPGWLVDAGDEQALVDAITAAMDPEAYLRAARDARTVFDQLLTPRVVLDSYEAAYLEAVGARSRAADPASERSRP